VIHFDHETELLQDLTSSRSDLQRALDQLELPPDFRRGGGGYPRDARGRLAGTHSLRRDLSRVRRGDEEAAGAEGDYLLTDGVDKRQQTFLNDAIEAAQRADTLAYSILFADEQQYQRPPVSFGGMGGGIGGGRRSGGMGRPPGGTGRGGNRPDGRKILQRISRETAGLSTRFLRSCRSTKSSTKYRKNYEASTTSGTRPTKRMPTSTGLLKSRRDSPG